MIDPIAVADRARALHSRLARAGAAPDLQVVAVTKGFGPDAVRAAVQVGLVDVGENYAQEVVEKARALVGLEPPPRVHFIGRLQRNKIRLVADLVTLWQSVDRPELVTEIARRAPGAAVLIQLNLSGEEHKGGCAFAEAAPLVGQAIDAGLDVWGLMGVGPGGAAEQAREGFRLLVALADELALPVRSMGMSADLEVAVEEGSTMVRVGRDLFGLRPPRP